MNFASKYNLGDRVVAITQTSVQLPPEPCTACDATGFCELRGQRFHCPKCNGKRETQARGFGWVVTDSGTIGQIRIETPNSYEEDDDDVRDGALFDYMFTASGSGSIYRESRLFPSHDAAQAECNRRNGGAS